MIIKAVEVKGIRAERWNAVASSAERAVAH